VNRTPARAALDKQPHEVAGMFDGVAERYDLTNTVLSFGQDRAWRRATRNALALRPGERVLDVGAGTGVSTAALARSGAYAVGADLSLGMLRAGRRARPDVSLLAGDALALPFADGAFDAVTISFALRNVVDVDAALRELARVTRPGGRLVICEFSHPTNAAFRTVYLSYLMRSLPTVARAVSSNPDAYVYLAESIVAWPDQRALAGRVAGAGWGRVAWRDLTGGVVALHRGRKPT
jgi:demethylmenaquinone methyltransferase/2-methoxy-6-polyprenyl-1,4-benzoquinol methylase